MKNVVVPHVAPAPAEPKVFRASVYPREPLPPELVEAVRRLEASLGMPVFLFLQNNENGPFDYIHPALFEALHPAILHLPKTPVALVIDSPGGSVKAAYRIAMTLQRHCGGFVAFVPRVAKSAATLMALGAKRIMLGCCAELGPLDAQFDDPDRESRLSALDEVQSLDRLHAFALNAFDRTMFLLWDRSEKKIETLIKPCFGFVSQMMRPLLQNIDVVHYTQTSRVLRVAEEYAIRLLEPSYKHKARDLARHLVGGYPDHEFVIDHLEAKRIGLKTHEITDETAVIADGLLPVLGRASIIGTLREVKDANQETANDSEAA